eukprot:5556504-Amphidinium_carterae.1
MELQKRWKLLTLERVQDYWSKLPEAFLHTMCLGILHNEKCMKLNASCLAAPRKSLAGERGAGDTEEAVTKGNREEGH